MGTSSGWRMAGMEVPLFSTDSVEWRQLSVPSPSSTSAANTSNDLSHFKRGDSNLSVLCLVAHSFTGDRNENSFGMSGDESNPASLFRLYVDYGRYTEAINLWIEHMETLASIVVLVGKSVKHFIVTFEFMAILDRLMSSAVKGHLLFGFHILQSNVCGAGLRNR
ncbi:hypothetical protein OROGR_004210 [Orobanche gracilis]